MMMSAVKVKSPSERPFITIKRADRLAIGTESMSAPG